ncbi:MAG: hypothetical protein Q9227_008136 [Pyrenula ochraceoflavens]
MKTFTLLSASLSLLFAPLISAHGYVQQAVLSSGTYAGYNPNTDPYYSPPPQRIFRKIPGNGPVQDLTLNDLQCNGYLNSGSAPAPLQATVSAGSTMYLNWTTWPDTHKGPVITYMAACPGSCTNYMPGTAKVWFKIQQAGLNNGVWASDQLIDNIPYQVKIPSTLKPGNYIVRHELWALHAAYTYPGAQIYPSCYQVTVTGSGTKTPSSSQLVAFPGAYTPTTPGVVFDIYQGPPTYPIPGPAIFTG